MKKMLRTKIKCKKEEEKKNIPNENSEIFVRDLWEVENSGGFVNRWYDVTTR